MTQTEFDDRFPRLLEGYAASLVRSGRATNATAIAESRRQHDELLPAGLATERMLFLIARAADAADAPPVGWLWVGLPEPAEHDRPAWIYYVEVDAGQRGNGYGRTILSTIEPLLAERGVTRIGLNVFSDNPVARRLYESIGFAVTAQQMIKSIGPVAARDDIDPLAGRDSEL
ncbi:GNAT family N-acetyltransferase [Solwaraspora sp. WMMD406]|uniref:GNAT family N-acetyltransferase n=1 Tax=Solwaraspora sp. WMMD406 TaxID=3016095 RepID=UPI002415D5AE|nr:GNAT family N-acetyltransferase [Solwaraspora sp. WMMD406]MDG4766340.1 GNAT family N-acetyltransferase [Solwaraspora sp. WMMD406]